MALQENIVYKGMNIDNAYIKIVHLSGNKGMMYFNVQYYASKGIADTDINNENALLISKMYSYTPDLSSNDNLWIQLYNHLKTFPEFSNAIDC